MIQVAAQLLVYANPSSISSTVWAFGWMQRGNRIDGQNRRQTCLIQCIIESSSESSPYHCR
jgi:hypothetical protein